MGGTKDGGPGRDRVQVLEMQSLAIYARDTHINRDVAQEINAGLHILQQKITALDEVFRTDCQ